jgi:hypothetical protein
MVKLSQAAEMEGFFVEVSRCIVISSPSTTYPTTKSFETDSILPKNIGAGSGGPVVHPPGAILRSTVIVG